MNSDFLNSDLTITSIYIRPQANLNAEKLSKMKLNSKHLIMGDINAKHSLWGAPVNDTKGISFFNFIEDNNLVCLNNGQGTRIGHMGQLSHLDIVVSTCNISSITKFDILEDNWGSDHYPIQMSLFFKPNIISIKPTPKWNFKKANWNGYNSTIETLIETESWSDNISLDDLQQNFTDIILNSAKLHIPLQLSTKKHKYSPYWNLDCSEAISRRRKSEQVMRKNPTQDNKIQFRRDKAIVKIEIKRAKILYWEKYCKNLNRNSKITNIWKTIHRSKGNSQSVDHSSLLKSLNSNNLATLCNTFAEHFKTMSSDDNLEDKFKCMKKETITDMLQQNSNSGTCNTEILKDNKSINKEFTLQELNLALDTCNLKSSPGPDLITNQFLVNLSKPCKQYYLKVINKSWSDSLLPVKWKKAFVKHILKTRKTKNK